VAGPGKDGRCSTTNLAWVVDARDLARELRLAHVALLNDLEASAHGLPALRTDETVVLQEGAPAAAGNQALIAAGTGLGEAALYWDGRRRTGRSRPKGATPALRPPTSPRPSSCGTSCGGSTR